MMANYDLCIMLFMLCVLDDLNYKYLAPLSGIRNQQQLINGGIFYFNRRNFMTKQSKVYIFLFCTCLRRTKLLYLKC